MWLFYESMYTALGIIGLIIYMVCIIALAAGVTWVVVKISPTTTGKKPVAKSSDG